MQEKIRTMKNIHALLISLLVVSCTQPKYEHIGQEIIDGKVSAIKEVDLRGRLGTPNLKIWVQTPIATKEVEIHFEYEIRWKVGDSCLLIIEKYKEVEDEK